MWKKVVEDVIKQLNEKFGKESPLSTTRGKVLEYLGMTLDYTTAGKEKKSLYKYIYKMLTELPIDMNGTAWTTNASLSLAYMSKHTRCTMKNGTVTYNVGITSIVLALVSE